MENVEYVTTSKLKTSAIYMGFQYRVKKSTETTRYWECMESGCKGRFKTSLLCASVSTSGHHTHAPDQGKMEVVKCKDRCKKRARTELTPMGQVYAQEFSTIADAGIDLVANTPRYSSIKSSLYRGRQAVLGHPVSCKSRSEIDLTYPWTKTSAGEDFLIIDDGKENRILAFASPTGLENLSLINNSMLFMDGTFKSCCKEFSQLYTIHGDLGSSDDTTNTVPLVYALLPDKKKDTYFRLFKLLQNKCSAWKPTAIKIDYEAAAIQAVKEAFPDVSLTGCNFHFNQSIWRKVQNLGLVNMYRNDSDIRDHVRMMAALAYVPTTMTDEGWDVIMRNSPTEQKVVLFNDYFVDTWLENDIFNEMWNCYNQQHRTTNAVEGWHNRLNRWIRKPNPSIYELITALKQDEALTRLTMRQNEMYVQLPKKKKLYISFDRRLAEAQRDLILKRISMERFLKTVGYLIKLYAI